MLSKKYGEYVGLDVHKKIHSWNLYYLIIIDNKEYDKKFGYKGN